MSSSTENDDSASLQGLQVVERKIFGEPASKANSRRVVRFGGMSRLIKSQKALNYSDAFRQQCQPVNPLLEGDLRVTMTIYYASRRPDLDESLILDLMQGLIYVNDRQVKERHVYWGLDKDSPRAEIKVEQMPGQKKARTRRADVGNTTNEEEKAVRQLSRLPPVSLNSATPFMIRVSPSWDDGGVW